MSSESADVWMFTTILIYDPLSQICTEPLGLYHCIICWSNQCTFYVGTKKLPVVVNHCH